MPRLRNTFTPTQHSLRCISRRRTGILYSVGRLGLALCSQVAEGNAGKTRQVWSSGMSPCGRRHPSGGIRGVRCRLCGCIGVSILDCHVWRHVMRMTRCEIHKPAQR